MLCEKLNMNTKKHGFVCGIRCTGGSKIIFLFLKIVRLEALYVLILPTPRHATPRHWSYMEYTLVIPQQCGLYKFQGFSICISSCKYCRLGSLSSRGSVAERGGDRWLYWRKEKKKMKGQSCKSNTTPSPRPRPVWSAEKCTATQKNVSRSDLRCQASMGLLIVPFQHG